MTSYKSVVSRVALWCSCSVAGRMHNFNLMLEEVCRLIIYVIQYVMWKIPVPPKVMVLFWTVVLHDLNTDGLLQAHRLNCAMVCLCDML